MENGSEQAPVTRPFLSAGTYDFLKTLALVILPAAAALYFGLSEIWGLPKAKEVMGTVAVTETFLGVLLGLSSSRYQTQQAVKAANKVYDGVAEVFEQEDGERALGIDLKDGGAYVADKSEIVLRVINHPSSGKRDIP